MLLGDNHQVARDNICVKRRRRGERWQQREKGAEESGKESGVGL